MKQNVTIIGDCYASGERHFMDQWQAFRAATLRPLFVYFARWPVTPDGLTLLSLLFGLAFFPLLFVSYPLAFDCLFTHAVLDGLDGPLARYLGTASRRGSFTDTMVDQLVVTTTTAALMKLGANSLEVGLAYIVTYGALVAFSMVRNAMAIPYSWVVRPRLVIYLWMPIELYVWPGTLE
ncbi:MAG: phosphatidylglycerophosphate synthase [Verrucomicrobiales bacterium]|jgi:phosphatidylglycerophosphate synthase